MKKIEKFNNLLILGAGASIPYGFPSGYNLIWNIIHCAEIANHTSHLLSEYRKKTNEGDRETFYNEYWKNGPEREDDKKRYREWKSVYGDEPPYFLYKANAVVEAVARLTAIDDGEIDANRNPKERNNYISKVNNFARKLKFSGCHSIDFFLEKRLPPEQKMGKRLVAALLMLKEEPKNLFTYKMGKDWYGHIFNKLAHGHDPKTFGSNGLHIITFNYDRSLEHYLFQSFIQTYGNTDNMPEITRLAHTKIKELKILHVHGSLGLFNPMSNTPKVRRYDSKIGFEDIDKAANQINIVSDKTKMNVEILALTAKHTKFHFLGFGYDQRNIEKLNLFSIHNNNFGKTVYGTTMGLTEAEAKSAYQYFGKLYIETVPEEHRKNHNARDLCKIDKIDFKMVGQNSGTLMSSGDPQILNHERTVLDYLKNTPDLFEL